LIRLFFDGFGAYLAVGKVEFFADFVHFAFLLSYEEAGIITSVVLSCKIIALFVESYLVI